MNIASPFQSPAPNFCGLKNLSKKYKQILSEDLRDSPINKAHVFFLCPKVLVVNLQVLAFSLESEVYKLWYLTNKSVVTIDDN